MSRTRGNRLCTGISIIPSKCDVQRLFPTFELTRPISRVDNAHMPFVKGQVANPYGRPKGTFCGRIQALNILDSICANKKNQASLREALQEEWDEDPAKFFKTLVVPLLPKHHDITSAGMAMSTVTPEQVLVKMATMMAPPPPNKHPKRVRLKP